MKIITYLSYTTLGILIGLAAAGVFLSPFGKGAVIQLLIGASLVLIGSLFFAFLGKLFFARLSGQLDTEENRKLIADLVEASDDINDLKLLLTKNRSRLIGFLPLVTSFLAATRALNYSAIALGGVVGVGTLLTGYVQMERMAEQSRLMTIQNSLTEASRRSAQIIELASILESLEAENSNQDLILARTANLSRSLRPYQFLVGEDQLSPFISPERGQLLNMILRAKLDYIKINQLGADFSSSDLKGVDLSKTNLCAINLANSDLRDASFIDTNLCHANLSGSLLPSIKLFRPKTFNGSLNEAVAPTDDWLLKFFVGNTFDNVSEDTHWAGMFLDDRNEDMRYVWKKSHANKGNISEMSVALMNIEKLRDLSYYRQENNLIYDVKVPLNLGNPFENNFTDYEDYDQQRNELIQRQKNQYEQIQQLYEMPKRELETLQISNSSLLFGLPSRTQDFVNSAKLGLFEPRSDFRYISPGGIDYKIEISTSPDNFKKTDMREIDLSYSDLRYIDFKNADLNGANLAYSILPPYENLSKANLNNVNFEGAAIMSNGHPTEDSIGPSWTDEQLKKIGLRLEAYCTSGEADRVMMNCIYVTRAHKPIIVVPPDL